MAEDARRKDDQLTAMLARMDAKEKSMTELIMQVPVIKTGGRYKYDGDNKLQGPRNPQ